MLEDQKVTKMASIKIRKKLSASFCSLSPSLQHTQLFVSPTVGAQGQLSNSSLIIPYEFSYDDSYYSILS